MKQNAYLYIFILNLTPETNDTFSSCSFGTNHMVCMEAQPSIMTDKVAVIMLILRLSPKLKITPFTSNLE